MIHWGKFYADGGYYGLNDPFCYDDSLYDDEDEEDNEDDSNEDMEDDDN